MRSNTYLQKFPEFSSRIGRHRTQIYKLIGDGLLMPPVRISAQSVAWPSYETDEYLAAVIRGADDDELRELVTRLMKARTTAGIVPETAS